MNVQQAIYAPGISDFIDRCNAIMSGPYHELPVPRQRALYETLARHFDGPAPEGVHVREVEFVSAGTTKRFRLYRSTERRSDSFVFYIRGGGFVLGSLDTHDRLMSDLCAATGLDVVAADFRLAPEAPFPAAIDDCEDVLRHVREHATRFGLGTRKALICGDSSGGNMVVALCMRLRDAGDDAIAGQVLLNPVLDFSRWRNGGGDAPLLTAGEMEFYTACYAPGDVVLHEHVSPLIGGDFAGLPKAYVMAAELDSLREDSIRYVERLMQNGIRAELVVEPGLVHGAIRARNISDAARSAFERACAKLVQFADEQS